MPVPPPLPWRVRTRSERLILVVAAAAAVVAGIFYFVQRTGLAAHGCVWKCTTGIPCAGCGGTRAFAALVGGAPLEALVWNPGAVVAMVFGILAGFYAACVLVLRLEPWRPFGAGALWWKVALVAAIAGNWVYLLFAGRV